MSRSAMVSMPFHGPGAGRPARRWLRFGVAVAAAAGIGCGVDSPPAPSGGLTFAVLGDAPYTGFEERRFDQVIEQLNADSLDFVIRVGDIFWRPCSDAMMARRAQFDRIRHPVVYTPGGQ